MKMTLLAALMLLTGCASLKSFAAGDECTAPTPREAKITKRVWK